MAYITYSVTKLMCPLNKQIRDYIHVMDLADGHVEALKKLTSDDIGDCCYMYMTFVDNTCTVINFH